jgi:aryl-alcohol dehydrogenase-like predicted oxidoreductase
MNKRQFGNSDLAVSEIGFGAWGIGGPSMAGDIPIGWGKVDDGESIKALYKAVDLGINFFDTADFYGLGHSEELIGKSIGKNENIIIATKVGHRLSNQNEIFLDYSKDHIINACDASLKRLKRDCIDFYQLHSAKISHLQTYEPIEAMNRLKEQGKIRYWGLSLHTFHPEIEADYLMDNNLGDGVQLVFNLINQRALKLIEKAGSIGLGIIARMPLQFGLLTGKFNKKTRFDFDDHRYFRLTPKILSESLDELKEVWEFFESKTINKTALSLSFILSHKKISTVIPGMKTQRQVELNTRDIIELSKEDLEYIYRRYEHDLKPIVDLMEKEG